MLCSLPVSGTTFSLQFLIMAASFKRGLIGLVCFTFCTLGVSSNQDIVCYTSTSPNCISGCGVTGRYMYDLAQHSCAGQDNSVVAVTGAGIWILYDEPGYLGESEQIVFRDTWECVRLHTLIAPASSVRHVGDCDDASLPSISLYEGANLTGREIYITDDSPKTLTGVPSANDGNGNWDGYADKFGSLIVTGGPSSCWTLYFAMGFNLSHACVCGIDEVIPNAIPNNPFPPENRVGSVEKGCSSAKGTSGQIVHPIVRNGMLYRNDGMITPA